MHESFLQTPVGPISIQTTGEAVSGILFIAEHMMKRESESTGEDEPQILLDAAQQLEEYFSGQRKIFELQLAPHGTPFQKRVWHEIAQIPYGQVMTYGEIASRVGNPNKARAVGQAANRNPIPIIVPCHRVVGAQGRLGGFAPGVSFKKILLHIER